MDALISKQIDNEALRAHPWTSMVADDGCAYIDFKKQRSVDDFVPRYS